MDTLVNGVLIFTLVAITIIVIQTLIPNRINMK